MLANKTERGPLILGDLKSEGIYYSCSCSQRCEKRSTSTDRNPRTNHGLTELAEPDSATFITTCGRSYGKLAKNDTARSTIA